MFRSLVLLAICVFTAGLSKAQNVSPGFDISNYGVRIEPDKRVMIVLATLETARTTNEGGQDVPVINTKLSPEGAKFRELLKSDLAAMPADLRQKISNFVVQHKRRNANVPESELVAPFISMAYALTPAPELADPIVTSDLPGNLLDVLDFAPLVREFYRRSSFSGNINEYVKTYQKTADGRLRSSTREMVSEMLAYLNTRPKLIITETVRTETQKGKSKSATLRNVERRDRDRSFSIVPELLAPTETVNFVNIKDDYFVVVPAELPTDRDLGSSEVRRGFLQFVVDPLVYGSNKDIETIRPVIKNVLDERRKTEPATSPDIYLTITRSMVAAIDAKQAEYVRSRAATVLARRRIDAVKTEPEKKKTFEDLEKLKASYADDTALRLSEDYEKGAVLAFYFAEQLKGFEDSGFDIASSLKEMLLAFDGTKETDRLGQFADARKRALVAREERRKTLAANTPIANVVVENPVTNKLIEIQKLITAKNYAQANAELKNLLQANPTEARIHYNLGRVASLTAETAVDPAEQAAKLKEAKQGYEFVIDTFVEQQKVATKGIKVDQPIDRTLVLLTYVALAKIYEFLDEKKYAEALYDQAIKIGQQGEPAHNEALTAKARLVKEQ